MLGSLLLTFAAAAAKPRPTPTLDALLRRPQYEDVEISPDGKLLAIAFRIDHDTRVDVLRRADFKGVAQLDPGSRGEIAGLAWLDDHQLLVAANRAASSYNAPLVPPRLYLQDIHKSHPKILPASLAGTIDGDDQHILITACGKYIHGDCSTAVRRLDLDHLYRDGDKVADAPLVDAMLLIDHGGRVRFAWNWDKNDRSKLYLRQAPGKWKLINDSDHSHLTMVPLAVSRDNRSAYLQVEHASGPDSIDRFDFSTGTRTQLLRDKVSDPLGLVYAADARQPVGAWFGPGRPRARFWQPDSADARWRQGLGKVFPSSNVHVISASRDGMEVVVRTDSDRTDSRYYLIDRRSHHAMQLARTRPWLKDKAMPATEPFTLAARDGLTLHGFVTRPVGAHAPSPMVVVVHGGPYSIRDTWYFDPETQLLVAHGYAVLRVNFRGSSGFGHAFAGRGVREWGAAMQDDITDATRWAIKQGLADPRRICIYGGSYGGYAALMGVAREPGLYRCAIGLAGVYDLNKLYHWGDIHRSDFGLHYLHTVLGQDKKVLAARSPVNLVQKIKVPVLLVHGELDARVPAKFAHEMRDALERAGDKVEYVEYPWEGHGLARSDDLHDFYRRLLAFLDAHTGSPAAKPTR